MAAMTFGSLTGSKQQSGSIRHWANHGSIDAEEIVADAETWLAERLRTTLMIKRFPFTLNAGEAEKALPATFLQPVTLWSFELAREVEFVPEFEIDQLRSPRADGTLIAAPAERYTVIGEPGEEGAMLFDHQAIAANAYVLTHYARPLALSADNPENLFTRQHRSLFRQVCLGLAYLFMKEEGRANATLSLAGTMVASASEAADLARQGQQYDTRTRHG